MNNNETFDSNNRLIESDKQYKFEDMYTKLSKQKEKIETIRNNYSIDFLNKHIYPLLTEFSSNNVDMHLKINIKEILPDYAVYKKQITDNLKKESFDVCWTEDFLKISWDLNKKYIEENSIYFKVLKNQEILDRNYKKNILVELKDYVVDVLYKQMEDSIGYSDFLHIDLPKKFRTNFCKVQLIDMLKSSNIYSEYINSFKLKIYLNGSYADISAIVAKERKKQIDIKIKETLSDLKHNDKHLVFNNFDIATLLSAFLLIIFISLTQDIEIINNIIFLSAFTKNDLPIIKNIFLLTMSKGLFFVIIIFIKNISIKLKLKRSILLEKEFDTDNKIMLVTELLKTASYFCSILAIFLSIKFFDLRCTVLFYIIVLGVLCLLEISIYFFKIFLESV